MSTYGTITWKAIYKATPRTVKLLNETKKNTKL